MAEWSFDPDDLPRVLATCRKYFGANRWPNIPTEIELTKTDDYWMSAWNWKGKDYIVKFCFLYLTDVGDPKTRNETIGKHLEGLWKALEADGIPLKAHWAKINFMDRAFVEKNHDVKSFRPLVQRLLRNDYLEARIG
jgi:hypothetical protein